VVMKLPFLQTQVKDLSLMQSRWISILNPVLENPTTNLTILKNVVLASGNNTVPHLLQQLQQGWVVLDINAAATVYRYAPFTDTVLYLHASAPVMMTLGVF
jgi:hypothetical protein